MLEYYEPRLDLTSPEHADIMGVTVSLKHPVEGEILRSVVEELRVRFPYFYVKVGYRDGDLTTVPNDLPMTVRNTWAPIRLNSKASNHHLGAWKYEHQRLAFEIPHVMTDAAGLLPYFKSVLYLYLSRATGERFDPAGFRLPGEGIPESETGDPFRNLDFEGIKGPLYKKQPIPDFLRLVDGTAIDKRVFYLKLSEAQVMRYCRDRDASPNVLFSVLMARAARRYDPGSEKPVTGFVAIDHKAILGNHDNYRLFVDNILLDFPKRLNLNDLSWACTIAHGQLLLQAQPENSLWQIKQRKQMPPRPFRDVPQASICVSYPKNTDFGPLDPYIQEVYIVTSLSKMTDVLCEVTCANHSFFIAFMQPFASTKYLDLLLEELDSAGIQCKLRFSEPLRMCSIQGMNE